MKNRIAFALAFAFLGCGGASTTTDVGATDANADAPVADAGADASSIAFPFVLARPGARLKTVRWAPVSGQSFTFDLYDSHLGATCYPAIASDGKRRCIPATSTANVAYLDSDCTKPVVNVSVTRCGAPPFMFLPTKPGCPATSDVVKVGPAVPATVVYQKDSAGKCDSANPIDLVPDNEEHPLEVVDPSMFAELEKENDATPTGIGNVWVTSADGARRWWNFRDIGGDFECNTRRTADGKLRCAPAGVARSTSLYSDDACTKLAGSSPTSTCDQRFIQESVTDGCETRGTYYSGVQKVATPYQKSGNACVVSSTTRTVYSVGAEIPATTFAEVTVSAPKGEGRLQMTTDTVGTIEAFSTDRWWDTQLKENCFAREVQPGKFRCFPASITIHIENRGDYADAECTKQLTRVDSCFSTAFVIRQSETCPTQWKLFKIGAEYTGDRFRKGSGGCYKQGTTDGVMRVFGDEVPFDTLAEIKREIL